MFIYNKMEDHNHREVLSRLKFISKIQTGEKINLRYMYIQNDGLITQFFRTLFPDNRIKTFAFVTETINKSFEILKFYGASNKLSEKIMCRNLIYDLKESKNGLVNLKETYNLDLKFGCDIQTLLQMIDAKLLEYEHLALPPPPLSEEEL
jgi:hypothetical protein